MKNTPLTFLAAFLTIVVSLSVFNSAFAQPSQVSYTVNLNSLTLQLTYPAQVLPGGSVSVSVQANPKSGGVYLQSLTATVYYSDSSGLHSIATQTLISNPAYSYGSYVTSAFSKSFTVNVPQDAPRTSLVAVFSESVQSTYYFAYPCFVDIFLAECTYQYGWYPYSYSSYSTTSDDAIAPLSYIQATTPEYVALQSTYQQLQQQLNQTQAQLSQSQAQLAQSHTQNQQLQSTVSQQGDRINQLNQQLANANAMSQTYQLATLALGIIAVILLVFTVYLWRRGSKQAGKPAETSTTSEPT